MEFWIRSKLGAVVDNNRFLCLWRETGAKRRLNVFPVPISIAVTDIVFRIWYLIVLLAYVKQPLIEHNNCLVSGSHRLPMWILPNDDKEIDDVCIDCNAVFAQVCWVSIFMKIWISIRFVQVCMARATSRPNLSALDAPILNVRFSEYLVPIMAPILHFPPALGDFQVFGFVRFIFL